MLEELQGAFGQKMQGKLADAFTQMQLDDDTSIKGDQSHMKRQLTQIMSNVSSSDESDSESTSTINSSKEGSK